MNLWLFNHFEARTKDGGWEIKTYRISSDKILYLSERRQKMSLLRVILAILFPPLAVIDYGCGSVLIVFLLTLAGWVPGVIAALIILNRKKY